MLTKQDAEDWMTFHGFVSVVRSREADDCFMSANGCDIKQGEEIQVYEAIATDKQGNQFEVVLSHEALEHLTRLEL